ncbi:MAG: hypothetical protein KIT83_02735 [Bryobacterales bacterium]|nr:hypothetical protein [Bryobacterales bacterium]
MRLPKLLCLLPIYPLVAVLALPITVNADVALGQTSDTPSLRIEILEGEGAVNNIRQRVGREPIVRVVDRNDRPVAGAAVAFLLPQSGAGGSFSGGAKMLNVITNQQGVAAARGFQLNAVAGDFQIRVTASFQGQTASTAITQTNTAALAGSAGAGSAGGAAGGAGGGLSTGAVVGIVAVVAGAALGVALGVGGGGGGPTPSPGPTPTPTPTIGVTLGAPSVTTPAP